MLSKSDYKKICKQLKLFGFRSYKDFLESNLWKEYRKVLYRRDRPLICDICKNRSEFLFLHHQTYRRLLDPATVMWVCKKCHEKTHKKTGKSIQEETNKLMGKGKKPRVASLRIITSSKLPETLHHSLHASGVIREVRKGESAKGCLDQYLNKKLKKNDTLMINLLEDNYILVLEYLATFTTR